MKRRLPVLSFLGSSWEISGESVNATGEIGLSEIQIVFVKVLGFRLRAFAAVLNPGLGNGRTLRSPTGEIGLSEIQIVFVKVSICPETMKLHPESLRETNFEATAASFEFSWKFSRKSK